MCTYQLSEKFQLLGVWFRNREEHRQLVSSKTSEVTECITLRMPQT